MCLSNCRSDGSSESPLVVEEDEGEAVGCGQQHNSHSKHKHGHSHVHPHGAQSNHHDKPKQTKYGELVILG